MKQRTEAANASGMEARTAPTLPIKNKEIVDVLYKNIFF